jgi:hypothetical protein
MRLHPRSTIASIAWPFTQPAWPSETDGTLKQFDRTWYAYEVNRRRALIRRQMVVPIKAVNYDQPAPLIGTFLIR